MSWPARKSSPELMASLRRVPKSGKDWTLYDLDAYHIDMRWQNHHTFFGVTSLPNPDSVDAELLETSEATDMVEPRNADFIHLMHLAMLHHAGEPATADFVVELFKRLGYVHRHRIARTGKDMQLLVCEYRSAKADVCIVDQSAFREICLLVKEDRRRELNLSEGDHGEAAIAAGGASPEAELIAAAIAAFVQNNVNRQYAGLPELTNTVIPGIIIARTTPTFFKIPITKDLVTHVRHGTYPLHPTIASSCHPPPTQTNSTMGMTSLENRRQILSCFEAFFQGCCQF